MSFFAPTLRARAWYRSDDRTAMRSERVSSSLSRLTCPCGGRIDGRRECCVRHFLFFGRARFQDGGPQVREASFLKECCVEALLHHLVLLFIAFCAWPLFLSLQSDRAYCISTAVGFTRWRVESFEDRTIHRVGYFPLSSVRVTGGERSLRKLMAVRETVRD